MEPQQLTNLSYLEEVTGGEAEIIKEFIEMFFEQIPEFRQGLRNYLNNKQWKELGDLAHKAKSSVMTFGMEDLGKHLKQLQLKTQQEAEIDTYEAHVKEFETLIDIAEQELRDVLSKL